MTCEFILFTDHATELKITEDKVERLEAAIVSLKAENERLQLINSDLEEKAETSELQINSISSQYRGVIQEKEDEIKSLKEEQHKWQSQSFQTDSMMIASSPPALATSTSTSSLSSSALLVPGDNDFHDIITAQQEINKMSAELSRLQAECDHWKQMASSKVQPSFQVGVEEATSDSDVTLNARIKELESKLQREIDESQHELSALQDVHSQKLANMARQHKSEIEKYKEKVEQLEEDLMYAQDGQSAGDKKESDEDTLRQKLHHIQKELDKTKEDLVEVEAANSELQSEVEKLKLKERQSTKQRKDLQGKIIQITKDNEELSIEKEKLLQSLEDKTKDTEKMKMAIANEDTASKELELLKRTLQEREKELEEAHLTVEQVSEELLATKRRLLASLDDNHASASAMLKDVQSARRKFSSDATALKCQLFLEKQALVKEMIDIGQKMEEGQRSVEDLEAASQEVQDETVDLISRMGKTENTKAVEENSRLTAQVSRLQTELEELNARCASLSSDKEHSEMMIAKLNQDIQYLKEGKDLPPDLSSRTDSTIGYSTDTQSAASDVSHDTNQGSALGMEGNSDTQSFDGEFDDSHIFATIRQRYLLLIFII
ncbi:Thyroid receptor-interacting protein 11 [Holothuria leucospilota]|uniref:Thyroid receptor-interacting protein 11 n=1 Tax=Holothuria leucospilota TaxID=206669 RepID=A0A9Q1CD78_HOLLE|nr:Thyroid receptor-interacting protein 11 [Holothuria leucospilota]